MDENHHSKKFEQILLNSIDEALSALGENAKSSIYFQQEEKFMIARQDIPYSVEDFSYALEQIFGLGARHLEILFMKNLHAKVEVTCGPLINGPVKVDCSRPNIPRIYSPC